MWTTKLSIVQRSLFAILSFCVMFSGCGSGEQETNRDEAKSARSNSDHQVMADETESDKFLGTWEYLKVTFDGEPFDIGKSPDGGNARIVVTKDSWTIYRHGIAVKSTWKVDLSTNPKTLIQQVEHPEFGKFVMESIYRFNSDGTLETCEMDHPDKPKPKRFVARKGDGQFSAIIKRVQPK